MLSVFVVVSSVLSELVCQLLHVCKPVFVQKFATYNGVEAFDETILGWFSLLDKVDFNVCGYSPGCHRVTNKFRAVVYNKFSRLGSAIRYSPIQDFCDLATCNRCCTVQVDTVTGVFIQQIENTTIATALGAIGHKIRSPDVIDGISPAANRQGRAIP